jgi:methylase of polypeptide subunit release factors
MLALRRTPGLTRLLFGVRVPAAARQAHWDLVTLVLRRVLARIVRRGDRVLEVGCGEAGVLSVWLRLRGAEVTAFDIAEEAVAGTRRTAAANGVTLDVRCSDLLQALRPDESFDIVFFDPPFVATALGEAAHLAPEEPRRVWDGGPDGTTVIQRFLEPCARLPRTTMVLLGFNGHLVDAKAIQSRAEELGMRHVATHSAPLNPARVLELQPGRR